MDILQKIFDGKYDITPIADKKQQELDDKCCAEWDRVVQVLGLEFADRQIGRASCRERVFITV